MWFPQKICFEKKTKKIMQKCLTWGGGGIDIINLTKNGNCPHFVHNLQFLTTACVSKMFDFVGFELVLFKKKRYIEP